MTPESGLLRGRAARPVRMMGLLTDWNRRREGVAVGAFAPLIVFDAEVLDDLAVRRAQLCRKRDVKWLGERSRIIDRDHTPQRVVVGPRVPLDHVEFLGVRRACAVEPELVVETDSVDDERGPFPVPDRVAIP